VLARIFDCSAPLAEKKKKKTPNQQFFPLFFHLYQMVCRQMQKETRAMRFVQSLFTLSREWKIYRFGS
jgi:hypothetical protein